MNSKLKKYIVLIMISVLLLSGFQLPVKSGEQEYIIADLFPDPILAQIIATGLKKEKSDLVTKTQLSKFGSLIIKNQKVSDLTGMENLTNITGLQVTNTDVADLTPIANILSLTDLTLTYNKIIDITPIRKLTKVKNLKLQGNAIHDISALAGLANLATINLYANQVVDIQGLESLNKITALDLGMNRIQKIEALRSLTNLKSVQLNSNLVEDITPLQDLPNLAIVGLFSNNIRDISPTGKIKTLTSLDFSSNKASNISSLKELTQLTYLKANDNGVENADVVALFPQLTYLNLAENELTAVTPLKNLTRLEELNISENHISDITPLNNLPQLLNFYATNQQVVIATTSLGASVPFSLKDRDGQTPSIYTNAAYSLSGDKLAWDKVGIQQLFWSNNQGDFSGQLTQEVREVSKVFLDEFTLSDKYLTGVYSNPDIVKMSVEINQKIYYGGDVINNKLRFYVDNKISKTSDTVIVKTYNKKGEVIENVTLKIREIPKDSAKWANHNFLFLGDSITIGLRANVAFPNIVAKQLRLPTIQNEGISGASVAQNSAAPISIVRRLEALDTSNTTDVVIFGGTNDFQFNTPMGTPNSTDENTFYGALNQIAEKLKASNTTIHFVTPMWRARQVVGDGKDSDLYPNKLGLYLNDYGTAVKNVASKYNARYLDLYSEKAAYENDLPDGLHPNNNGQYFIGEKISLMLNE
ncbi:Internalin A [Listeria grandensis FSL F6-0971]|uniref:Internalin A n=1 Tax=Listeria grandensis FSL F6-0971 TaxID=1265819 RepID=W7BNW9_9LIST|nr:leucine-rich repeat domain-containing protein [Listeria grandensis]EUJ21743.1 Internalin A [Listeria grandensis FSL F6-0971]